MARGSTDRIVIPKEIRHLADAVVKQGWTIDRSRGGHLRFTSPTGKKVFTSATPSEYRGKKNLTSQLRRAGADV